MTTAEGNINGAETFDTTIATAAQERLAHNGACALGRGASAALAGAVERLADDVQTKKHDLYEEWERIKREGDALLEAFAADSEALLDTYLRQSKGLQAMVEAFADRARASQIAVRRSTALPAVA